MSVIAWRLAIITLLSQSFHIHNCAIDAQQGEQVSCVMKTGGNTRQTRGYWAETQTRLTEEEDDAWQGQERGIRQRLRGP